MALSHGGAARAQGRDRRAHIDVPGYSRAGAIIRSTCLSSWSGRARLARSCRTSSASDRGGRSRHDRAAWRVHRVVAICPSVPVWRGLIRHWAWLGVFPENGVVSHVPPFQVWATGHGDAPFGGSFESPGSLERGRRRSLIRAAVQHRFGAVAPAVLCDHVAAARGSNRTLCRVRARPNGSSPHVVS